mmetsp:Transcript_15890/g.23933  ORF Transcript_15890/g.23933 Transcript_15890/m.23933 type:complete len:160 (+) Transcript_15890:49-528(+)
MHIFFRSLFLVYFITHIPITLLVDLQGAFGEYYPDPLRQLVAWYVLTFKDFLMGSSPAWFRSFLLCEAFFQLPLFFVAVYAIWEKKNWIRIPLIVYGSHVSTTVIPCVFEFFCSDKLEPHEKMTLFGIYSPYLFIPLIITLYMCLNSEPFHANKTKKIM